MLDENDIYVLVVVVVGYCDVILIVNIKDFFKNLLVDEGIDWFDFDNFFYCLWLDYFD